MQNRKIIFNWKYSKKSIHTFGEALNKLKKMSKIKNIKHVEYKPFVRPTEVPYLITNSKDFYKATNWKPTSNFEKILQDTLNYWRQYLSKK